MNKTLFNHLYTYIHTLPNHHIPMMLALLRAQQLTRKQKRRADQPILRQVVLLRMARQRRVKSTLRLLGTSEDAQVVLLRVCTLMQIYVMLRDRRFLVCSGVLARKYGLKRVISVIKRIVKDGDK